MNLIILGPQGSGKGTQARMLAEKFDLEYLEMGRLLRDVAKTDTPLGKQIHERINVQGRLVDDETIRKVLSEKLRELPKEKGVVFDGVPRNEEQTRYFDKAMQELGRHIDLAIDINITEAESIARLSRRRVCRDNEHVLIMGIDVKDEKGRCPLDGSEIFQRADDTPERIEVRLGIYYKDTKAVLDHYRAKGILVEIDGVGSIEEVHRRILDKLKEISQ